MNIIKYKGGGKTHVIETDFSFNDLSDEIIARKVYVKIRDDSEAKLSSEEIRFIPSPDDKKVMCQEELDSFTYITDIEFIDYGAQKILTMKRMSDHINHNYQVSSLIQTNNG